MFSAADGSDSEVDDTVTEKRRFFSSYLKQCSSEPSKKSAKDNTEDSLACNANNED